MDISKKQLSTWIISAILIVAVAITGIYLYESRGDQETQAIQQQEQVQNTVNISFSEDGKTLSYDGQSGKTALELLTIGTEVGTSGSGENTYVTSINGIEADLSNSQFWAFYINGESASVGAGSYTTLDSDVISWELTTF
jgi:hypothetical protein